ncbi:MAG: hypothetical protein KGR98_07175 [Verrucomicrobia bacterium]|nr:hypothetical protein [Verrucomicrobiota bacterium]MDE3099036.1 hypothetical protein [Verrucomicrobiota bacterium]
MPRPPGPAPVEESEPAPAGEGGMEQRVPEAPRHGSPLLQAADEVAAIIDSLRGALDQMEEVLELIETAEGQKIADEREIESLRRLLRQLQGPRQA